MRYVLEISYDGTSWHGWQRQPNAPTVQQAIEEALQILLKTAEIIPLTASGRTDTGVHAKQQFAHFDGPVDLRPDLVERLRGMLPSSIGVTKLFRAEDNFHARYDATNRGYQYIIQRVPSPFEVGHVYYFPHRLQLSAMAEAAHMLLGVHDFASFCKAGGSQKHTYCEMLRSRWRVRPNQIIYEVQANRFLRGMVRALVGTLLDVGTGKLAPEDMLQILSAKARSAASRAAPAEGLFLSQVNYPEGTLQPF